MFRPLRLGLELPYPPDWPQARPKLTLTWVVGRMPSSSKTKLGRKLNTYTPLEPTDKTKDSLRDFFTILPPDGKQNLAGDVLGCADDEKLRQLQKGGKTPIEITPSPRSGVEDSIENLKSQNIEPISGSCQSRLRHRCLERDGNKCLATGHYSHNHAHPQNAMTTHLEAAHIIPFALGSFQANDGEAFRLIFEATGVAHQYRIKTFPDTATAPIRDLPRNRLVKFKVHKGSWELPDSNLLGIHACIGNFLHMSGQAEIIDKVLKDFEDCGDLAPSGSINIGDLLAVSGLSLLPSNTNKTRDSRESLEKQRPLGKQDIVTGLSLLPSNIDRTSDTQKKQRPTEKQGRLRAKSLDTENKSRGY
ncbi:uncharacterized protein N7515_009429 [Penicillium bovifimosum]|uniref:HNH nuclease domain-containing protein n=1 Tax=Penicillium bovifimosum TaxID=126998 RepID=A0A9W9GJA4_9EURO|nr:uncharacterized protein N7515_009429 [Penicillium bovifimosum]KAJ5121468.1 hypothetical protein N7515_009429 [Penicillium bovifimosum]